MTRLLILLATLAGLAEGHAATVVLHCLPQANHAVTSLDVQLEGDFLEAVLELPGAPEKIRHDVTVHEHPNGYYGHYLELTLDDWDKTSTGADLVVQVPIPVGDSAFRPNLRTRLTCRWR